jgi:hypothetical protein
MTKNNLHHLFVVITLAISLSSTATGKEATHILSGIVRDASTSNGIPDLLVTAQLDRDPNGEEPQAERRTITSSSGNFSIQNIVDGHYWVTICDSGNNVLYHAEVVIYPDERVTDIEVTVRR